MEMGITVASNGSVLHTIDMPLIHNPVALDQSALGAGGAAELYVSQSGRQDGQPYGFAFTPEQPNRSVRYAEGGFSRD